MTEFAEIRAFTEPHVPHTFGLPTPKQALYPDLSRPILRFFQEHQRGLLALLTLEIVFTLQKQKVQYLQCGHKVAATAYLQIGISLNNFKLC